MIELGREAVEAYLREMFGPRTKLLACGDLASLDEQGMKRFGYGKPVRLVFEVEGETREAVLSTMRGDKYGHQFYWDRAAILMFQFETGGRMERHVKPLGLGYVDGRGVLWPVRDAREYFIVNELAPGYDYFQDLERIHKSGPGPRDLDTAREFARFLARVHAEKREDPDLYYRRARNLLGASECILGIIDQAYPHPFRQYSDERFMALEKRLIDWRWKLKDYAYRLSAVHGDFHPWNVLVEPVGELDEALSPRLFQVLDRSRGEWGEPAEDIASMAANYLLFGLTGAGGPRLSGPFERLYRVFFDTYLDQTNDHDLFRVIAPFFVFRCLVIASPEWYPAHPPEVRRALFRFMENILDEDKFDPGRVNGYME